MNPQLYNQMPGGGYPQPRYAMGPNAYPLPPQSMSRYVDNYDSGDGASGGYQVPKYTPYYQMNQQASQNYAASQQPLPQGGAPWMAGRPRYSLAIAGGPRGGGMGVTQLPRMNQAPQWGVGGGWGGALQPAVDPRFNPKYTTGTDGRPLAPRSYAPF